MHEESGRAKPSRHASLSRSGSGPALADHSPGVPVNGYERHVITVVAGEAARATGAPGTPALMMPWCSGLPMPLPTNTATAKLYPAPA